jgi:hypothetical protein
MILSERGAIGAAIADGGFHLYPAGRIMDMIKQALPGDLLKGNFDPQRTINKVNSVPLPADEHARAVFEEDKSLLCSRLSELDTEYDIQSAFSKMSVSMPMLAKKYYGIEGFEPPAPQIVEYFFEGHNDLYRDADWIAFNVNRAESQELNVPVGAYYKRDRVSPGLTEFSVFHEANHAMQEIASLPPGVHHYVPWLDEGLADIIGRMMLFAVTENEKLLKRIKNFKTEIEVTDNRKTSYHYSEETAGLLLMRGRLPLVKALLKARKEYAFEIDWSELARSIKGGTDPHIGIVNAYKGSKKDTFHKKLTRDESNFRQEADLNQSDLKALTMFLACHPPAVVSALEYRAARFFMEEISNASLPHFIDPMAIPEGLRANIAEWKADAALPAAQLTENVRKKLEGIEGRIAIRAEDIPGHLIPGADALANKYFVIKRKIGDAVFYEPFGGGLPFRMGSGEIRCAW